MFPHCSFILSSSKILSFFVLSSSLNFHHTINSSWQHTHWHTHTHTHTDVITLTSSSVPGSSLDETDISLSYERGKKFKQVTGFQSVQVASSSVTCDSVGLPTDCKTYVDPSSGLTYKFFYPNDKTVQYLYETYPKQISPVRGVTDEHFIVWMRSSSLPKFRKLYGRIHENFKKGDILKFQVEANFEVRSFNADKAILITTESQFGAANPELGVAYIVVGSVSLFLGLLFSFKQCLYPRPLGNPRDLKWIKWSEVKCNGSSKVKWNEIDQVE